MYLIVSLTEALSASTAQNLEGSLAFQLSLAFLEELHLIKFRMKILQQTSFTQELLFDCLSKCLQP
jgi:hypothetical protein